MLLKMTKHLFFSFARCPLIGGYLNGIPPPGRKRCRYQKRDDRSMRDLPPRSAPFRKYLPKLRRYGASALRCKAWKASSVRLATTKRKTVGPPPRRRTKGRRSGAADADCLAKFPPYTRFDSKREIHSSWMDYKTAKIRTAPEKLKNSFAITAVLSASITQLICSISFPFPISIFKGR